MVPEQEEAWCLESERRATQLELPMQNNRAAGAPVTRHQGQDPEGH